MKHQYYTTPENMKGLESWGFSWLEFVTSIPAPMFLVTSYKSSGNGSRFFAILSSVNKHGHLYQTLHEKNCAVINFFTADEYDKAMATR